MDYVMYSECQRRTKHIALIVLLAHFLAYIARNTQEKNDIILRRIVTRVQPTQDKEPLSPMKFQRESAKSIPQAWKQEVPTINLVPVQTKP